MTDWLSSTQAAELACISRDHFLACEEIRSVLRSRTRSGKPYKTGMALEWYRPDIEKLKWIRRTDRSTITAAARTMNNRRFGT